MLPFAPVPQTSELFREVRIVHIRQETADTKIFELETAGWELVYKPGQFLTFVVPSAGGLLRRSYSFCSVPGEPPAIAVKRVANGVFSRPMLESAQPGDRLTVVGSASGFFVAPDDILAYEQILFFAAGSGITPIYSIIKDLLQQKVNVPILLAYSNSRPESTIFRRELEELERQHPGKLTIRWFFSNRQDLLTARLGKTSLDMMLTAQMKANPDRVLAYLCGPFDYMRMAAIVLHVKGIPADQIRREVFTPDLPRVQTPPPDTKKHMATLRIGGKVHRVEVQYPNTILKAARAVGVELPYSCESGRCGSCIAECTSGNVWMRYNEVLTDKEVDKGRVLVCQAFPVGGDVIIDYTQS